MIPYSTKLITKDFCYPSKATEYMNSIKPIFSSDLPILKECFKNRAIYFKSDDYENLFLKLNEFFDEIRPKKIRSIDFPSWDFRAKQIYKAHI